MARLSTLDFETTAEWTSNTSMVLDSTVARSGTYSGRIPQPLVSATRAGLSKTFLAAAGTGPYYFRFYLYPVTLPSAGNVIFTLTTTAGISGTTECKIHLTATGAIDVVGTGSAIATSSAMTLNVWNRIELLWDATAASGSQTITAYLNGTQFATSAAQTLVGVIAANFGGNLSAEAQTTGLWYFDSVAINDSTGSTNNGLPGDIPGNHSTGMNNYQSVKVGDGMSTGERIK